MDLKETINQDLLKAMKSGDKNRLNTLRMMKKEITEVETRGVEKLSDAKIVEILRKMCSSLEDTAQIYDRNGRPELASEYLSQVMVIQEYLPQMMSREDIECIVKDVIGKIGLVTIKDMGQIIKEVKEITNGLADSKIISDVVRKSIS